MTQQIINLGSGPDTQTGDSLYTAFTKVNDNFTELYSVFDGNGISNINANVIISNNVVVSSNVRTGNIAAYGNIETIGYVITAGAFYPNGIPIGSLGAIGSNVLPLTTNLYTIGSDSLQFTQGYFSTNITLAGSNVTVREGALFVDGQIASGNYGNANVAAYLPVYGGNIDATITTAQQPYITQTGILSNLTADIARIYGNLVVEGNLSVDGNVTFFNVDNLLVEDPIITLNTGANGSPLTFDNGFDSGIKSYYYDTENREAFFGRKDDTGYFEYYSNVISEVGNIVSGTYGTIKTGNLILSEQANVAGNVTANYFLGNGRFLDGIDTTLISNGNSNVQVYQNGNVAISSGGVANVAEFTTIGGNITGDFYITGTIRALNYIGNVQGNLSAPGANTQVIFNDNSTAGAAPGFTFDKFTNTVVVGGNIESSGNIVVNNFTVIDSAGNIITARLQDSGVTAATYGNASAVPVITVDEKGRVTNVSTTAVAGVSNLTYNTATSNLTISTSAGTEFTVDLGVGTEDSPVFANTTITGNLFAESANANTIITDGTAYLYNISSTGLASLTSVNVLGSVDVAGNLSTNNLIIDSYISGNLVPDANIAYDLGTSNSRWKDLYLSGSSIYLDDTVLSANSSGLAISSNVIANNITSNGSGVFESTLQSKAGIQNTVIGNVTPASAIFTTQSVSGNSAVEDLTVNSSATIGSGLGVTGNIVVANGNLFVSRFNSTSTQLSQPVPGSDAGFRATLYDFNTTNQVNYGIGVESNHIWTAVDNNIEQLGFKWYGNTVQIARLSGTGNLVIANNLTASSASFGNSVRVASNVTAGNVASNGSITAVTTLSAAGGIQATPIGNVTPSTAQFTTVDASANATVNQLTVNSSATIGGTLGVTGAMVVAALDVAGHANVGHLQINGNVTGNIIPSANGIYNIGSTNYRYKDLYLSGNTLYLGDVALSSTENNFIISGNVVSTSLFAPIIGNTGTDFVGESLSLSANILTDGLTVNTSIAAGTTLSAAGGIQATPIGNAAPSTAQFTTVDASGNVTASAISVNNSITAGTTFSAAGGIQNTIIGNVAPSSAQFTTVDTSGNITTSAITVNTSLIAGTTLSAVGGIQATPIGNVVPSTAQFTTVNASGNVTVNALSVNNSVTIGSTLSTVAAAILAGGLQATPIGNVTPSSAIFTTQSVSGNSAVNALTVNTSSVVGGSLQAAGGIQASPIGNVTPSTAQFTTVSATGNITGSNITANGSITAGDSFSAAGGIQNTVIGNVTPSSAQFTTVNASGNLTVANLTVNSSITAGTTLSAAGGIQATPIGNVEPSTAQFTTVNVSGVTTVNSLISNTAIQASSLGVSANATVNALTVNTSATIGGTLGVSANLSGTSITLSGSQTVAGSLSAAGGIQATPIGNAAAATGAFTDITGSSLTITGNTILGNLDVLGTVTYINSEITTLKDPIIELNTGPNGAPLSGSAPYDSGLKTHYWDGTADRSAFFGRSNSSGYFEFYSNVTNETANVITGTLGTIRSGNIELTGTATVDSTLTVGANATVNGLTVNTSAIIEQTLQAQGGLQNTVIGNVVPSSAQFTELSSSGNITAQNIIVNASVTASGNISAPYFIGNIVGNITGNISAAGANTQILFNDNSLVGASDQFTFDKSANLLTVGGNITASGLAITGSGTFTSTISSQGGLQNTVIGNVTPAAAQFTTVDASANATINALSVNNTVTIGSTLGIVGNINGTGQTLSGSQTVAGSVSAAGGIQATPIGNAVASSGQFTTVSATGNITAAAVTANGSLTTGTTLSAAGGIQATPIGNVTPSTAQFTTVSTSANAAVNALTVNTSAVIGTTLSAQAGLQATAIGNVSASTGKFTSLETTGTATVNELVSNGTVTGTAAQFTTINGSANATVNALTVNTSAVIGQSLQAQGGLQATPIGNVTPDTAQFTTVSTSGNITAANISVNNSITVGSTLGVAGALTVSNTDASTSNVTGAVKVAGGIGVGGNIYVGNRMGWVAANSVSVVYQIYNASTNSLDTIFE